MSQTTETAETPGTLAIQQLADIVAANAAWQECVSAYSVDEARPFISKSYYRPNDGQIDRPFAIIFEQAGERWDRKADGVMMPRGELFLHLGRPMESDDPELEERRFNNWLGKILIDINRYDGPGYRMRTVATDPPERTSPADAPAQHPFWQTACSIEWDCYG